MVTKDLTVMPGKTLAARNAATPAKLMAAGLAVIREQLSDEVVQNFVVAGNCGHEITGDVQLAARHPRLGTARHASRVRRH